jgi:hypothetical protein
VARSRRGSFGLQPRVAPNVTGQIVALAREYVAKRDSLIMDAWKNGGTFEGKKATDDMVLKYWKEREVGLDKNDPDYEQAKDEVMQLQYGIAQSKADVLHVQGKMSDTEYAGFFLRWAKKVPHNSEFYRTLQKDAAQLIEAAKAKSAASGERARTEAFNAFVKNTTSKDIAIGDEMTKALSDLSKSTGLSITGNGDELLALLTQNVKANPNQYRALLDVIHQSDPHFDGNLTEGYFTQHLKSAVEGYDLIADRAQKAGFVSAYAGATQGLASMSQWGQNVKVWPVSQTYTKLENAFLKVWNDPGASQMDKMAAASGFSAQITKMANTPGIDAGSKTMLEADAQRLLGQDAGDNPSFGQSMLGRQGIDPKMTAQIGFYAQTADAMKAAPTAWAYAPVDDNGQYDVTGQGALGMVPAGSVPPGAQAVMIPGQDGKAVLAMVTPHPVYTRDPANPSAAPTQSGVQISYRVGGRNVQLWSYRDANGQNHWTVNSPVAPGATTTVDSKGDIYITPQVSPTGDPVAAAKAMKDANGQPMAAGVALAAQLQSQKDSNSPLGATITMNQVDQQGHVSGSVELKYKDGVFTQTTTTNTRDANGHVIVSQGTPVQVSINPAFTAQAAYSPSLLSAGEVPGVTFNSALQGSVQAASYTQTQDQVSKFASDPAFQAAFLSQTMHTLGTNDPYDPRIAQAWQRVTTATSSANMPTTRTPQNAALRADLRYPGDNPNPNAYTGAPLAISYNGGELRLPGLPSYLKNPFPATSGLPSYDHGTAGLGLPPQMPQGSPAVTASPAPTVGPSPSPTSITPTTVGVPTGLPTPAPTSITTAAPAPRPTSQVPGTPGYNDHGR